MICAICGSLTYENEPGELICPDCLFAIEEYSETLELESEVN